MKSQMFAHGYRARRAVAIALAAGLAVGGVQAINTANPLGTPIALAQDASQASQAVTFTGIVDAQGTPVTGSFDNTTENAQIGEGYKLRFELDLTKLKQGESIDVYVGANTEDHNGGGILVGEVNKGIQVDGKDNVLRVENLKKRFDSGVEAEGVRFTGGTGLADVIEGKATVDVPVALRSTTYVVDDAQNPVTQTTGVRKDQPVKYWIDSSTGPEAVASPAQPLTLTYNLDVEGLNQADSAYRSWLRAQSQENDVELYLDGRTPKNPENGTISVLYDAGQGWTLAGSDEWKPSITGVRLINGSTQAPLTQAQIDAVKLEVTPDNGKMRVTISNIPTDALVDYQIRNVGYVNIADSTKYEMDPKEYNPANDASGTPYKTPNSSAHVAGLRDAKGNVVEATRKPVVEKVTIDGKDVDPSTPTEVEVGKEVEVTFTIKNEGNTVLSRPTVTLPNGDTVTGTGEAIQPGQTGTVTVKYTPSATDKDLTWKIQYSNADPKEATATVKPVTPAGNGSSEQDKERAKCIAEKAGLRAGVPGAILILLGALSQVKIPGLVDVNSEIQKHLGIFDGGKAARAQHIFSESDMAKVAGGLAAVVGIILLGVGFGTAYKDCVPAEEQSSKDASSSKD